MKALRTLEKEEQFFGGNLNGLIGHAGDTLAQDEDGMLWIFTPDEWAAQPKDEPSGNVDEGAPLPVAVDPE